MRAYKPKLNLRFRTQPIECPHCGDEFYTSEAGHFQYHRCSSCGHAWKEFFFREVIDGGDPARMVKARTEHPNLDNKDQYLILTLRCMLGNMQRTMRPIQCATPGCAKRLERVEHLVAQLLVGGWPSTGGAPILCPDCAKTRSQGGAP